MSDKFPVTITAKMRHGKLWELRKKFGSNRALAKYLGMQASELGTWINLQKVPKIRKERRDRLDKKLAPYGLLLEDLFPAELTNDVLDRPKEFEVTREVSIALLASGGGVRLIENQEENIVKMELKDKIDEALEKLTPREEKVIRLRFGLGGEEEHNLKDIADDFLCSHTRIQQIEAKALRKLRHFSRSNPLREFVGIGNVDAIRTTLYQCVRYNKEKEIIFNFASEVMCDMYCVSLYLTGVVWSILRDSGSYMRIAVNDRIVWLRKILEEEIRYRWDGISINDMSISAVIVPNMRVRKGDKVSVEIGPITLTKSHTMSLGLAGVVNVSVELECRLVTP